jgi:protoheme ferro-lyase
MSTGREPGMSGAPVTPPHAAPPELVRRPRVALLVGHAPARPVASDPAAAAPPPHLERLAGSLAAALPAGWRTMVAVHGARPTLAEALREIEAAGVEDLVVLPLAPCFSQVVTGEMGRHLYRLLGEGTRASINLAFRGSWYDDVGYVSAQAAAIAECAAGHHLTPANCRLLLVAAALDHTNSADGDPYRRQVERSAQLVAERLGWPASRVSLAFQDDPTSGSDDVTRDRLRFTEQHGGSAVLLCPLPSPSFQDSRLERTDDDAVACASAPVYQCPPLASQQRFVAVLRDIVVRGVRPVLSCRPAPEPPASGAAGPEEGDPAALIMVGAAVAADALAGTAQGLRCSAPEMLRRVRKTRPELRACLERFRDEPGLAEAVVWDTCQRVECYGWLADPDDAAGRERIVALFGRRLFGDSSEALAVNVLAGLDAWRHLMRTACGLGSRVPGDTDALQQLQTARHIAEAAGAAGSRAAALVAEASRLAERVRVETAWGAFSGGYCEAALRCIPALRPPRAERGRHLVIGGSTTSRSILAALRRQFAVPESQLTLAYRDHHGQMKLLRNALGHGRRLRVHSYTEQGVLRAVAEADFVYLGIDQADPVLEASRLGGLRDLAARPLTIVDFNTFGSLGGAGVPEGVTVWSARELDEAVGARAAIVRRREEFGRAVAEAEECIDRHAPSSLVSGRC